MRPLFRPLFRAEISAAPEDKTEVNLGNSLYRLSIEKSGLIPPTLDCMLGNLPQRIGTAEDAGFDDVAVLADQCLDGDHPGYESSFGSGWIGWPGHAEEPAALNDTSRQ
jgi:hypothetical protein